MVAAPGQAECREDGPDVHGYGQVRALAVGVVGIIHSEGRDSGDDAARRGGVDSIPCECRGRVGVQRGHAVRVVHGDFCGGIPAEACGHTGVEKVAVVPRVVLWFDPAQPPVLNGEPSPPDGVAMRVVVRETPSETDWLPVSPSLVFQWEA